MARKSKPPPPPPPDDDFIDDIPDLPPGWVPTMPAVSAAPSDDFIDDIPDLPLGWAPTLPAPEAPAAAPATSASVAEEEFLDDIPDLPPGWVPIMPAAKAPPAPERTAPAGAAVEIAPILEPPPPAPRLPDHPVAIVGAGPTGLAAAIDLWLRGVRGVVLLDQAEGPGPGIRAFCWSRRTLEILTRLGVGAQVMAQGVAARTRALAWGDSEIFRQEVRADPGYGHPASVNLAQSEIETILATRLTELGHEGPRYGHRVVGLEERGEAVVLAVDTAEGRKEIEAAWVIAADGAESGMRRLLGLNSIQRAPMESVLLGAIRLATPAPQFQRFWLRPDFDRDMAASLQPLPGGLERVEFLLGPHGNPKEESQPARLSRRVAALLGPDVRFELIRSGHYVGVPGRLDTFIHGRVIFAGDAAHAVSVLGGRGANEGIADADNLCWKLAMIVAGSAGAEFLASYDSERREGIDQRFVQSSRALTLMGSAGGMASRFRDAALDLAERHPFARALVDVAAPPPAPVAASSPLNWPDELGEPRQARPGAPCPDAPVRLEDDRIGQLLDQLGDSFVLLRFAAKGVDPPMVRESLVKWRRARLPITVVAIGEGPGRLGDVFGLAASRLAGVPGAMLLIRPDKVVAARFARFNPIAIEQALARALGLPPPAPPEPALPRIGSKAPARFTATS